MVSKKKTIPYRAFSYISIISKFQKKNGYYNKKQKNKHLNLLECYILHI